MKSLLDNMRDGAEYGSLIDLLPDNINMRDEMRRAIAEVEKVRKRPLIIYAGNVLRPVEDVPASIILGDDLPFSELIASVPATEKSVDILLVTPGGSGQQVSQFVQRLRPRFENVAFLLPHMCMSAGTIWAMSGNEIWMDERAFLGPIDPQIPGKDGRYIPAQTVLTLIKRIQEEGDKRIANGQNPVWTDIQLLRNIDPKEIGNALSLTAYSIQLAATYLQEYKFRDWNVRASSGVAVDAAYRQQRAQEIAERLCSHELWKVHSHGISREVAWQELKIQIDHAESNPDLHRALRRLWATLYWLFEHMRTAKLFLSSSYSLFRNQPAVAK